MSEAEEMDREFDRILVRTLQETDLDGITRIDARITGAPRRDYFEVKLAEAMRDTGVRVSLGAEIDGSVVGFLMARLYFGEFGRPDHVAILDTIGVDPLHRKEGIGQALFEQFRGNLGALGIERIETIADWNAFPLLGFLDSSGFKPSRRLVLEATIG